MSDRAVSVINVIAAEGIQSRRGELTILRVIRKVRRQSNAFLRAKSAELRAQRMRSRGDIHAAVVWECHAKNCRRILGNLSGRAWGVACTP